jgi:peptidyl-prolyl cis-trans isomerase B (cyclophilin B)
LVDKPRRRKRTGPNWRKIGAVVVAALIVAAGGYFTYTTYFVKPPPEYAKITVGYANGTSLGTIEVELYPACAPKTVANFVSLANSGFYDNLTWHRIVKGFVIQTGDPNSRGGLNSTRPTWGQGGSSTTLPLEWCGWLHNYEGYIAMAHTQQSVDSGTSQFYINLSNDSYAQLDGNYTVFGKVISGMTVVQAIGNSPVCQSPACPSTWPADEPLPPVFVKNIVILGTTP